MNILQNNDISYKKKYHKYKAKYLSILSQVNIVNFLNWFSNNNGKSLLSIHKHNLYGRETKSRINIKKDSTILEIPPELLITTEQFNEFNIKDFVTSNNKLTFLLLYFKKHNKFKEYISILPTEFITIPITWDSLQLDIIKNTSLYDITINKIKTTNDDFKNLYNLTSHILPFSKKEYLWARLCVNSRNFGITKNNKSINCLAPFADMLNHSFSQNTKWSYDNKINKFVVRALQDIPINTIVTDTYGYRDAKTYLLWYGFFPKDLHTVEINGLNINSTKKDNINEITKNKILEKLNLLKLDYQKYSHLKDKKYEQPLEYLKTEIDILQNNI